MKDNQLYLLNGLQACGKTTAATAIGTFMNIPIVSNHLTRLIFPPKIEVYSKKYVHFIYDKTLEEAARLLKTESVVIDAMFHTRELRNKAYRLAENYNRIPVIIECVCTDTIQLEKRVKERANKSDPFSEGNKMKFYWLRESESECVHLDKLSNGNTPLIITYNSGDHTITSNDHLNPISISICYILNVLSSQFRKNQSP